MEPQRTFTPYGAPIRDAKLLPVQPPGKVIGRNRELGSMHVTLKIGSSVFLSGPSGIGKTALAAVLATAYVASNPGGVLWFNVVEDDFEMLLARIGRAYGVNALTVAGEEESSNDAEIVRALLEKNRPLIVLDGLIDLDATRDFVRQCASHVPTIIISEQSAAGAWTPINLEPLSDLDSVTLFQFYSGLTDSAYHPDIEGLCKFLGGNPLAIELAARQVAVDDQTPAELLTSLPSSTGQDSQLMMMSVIFKRLAAPAQAMLLVLAAMFTGDATAELMGDVSDVPANNIVPLMRQLVNRAIVRESIRYGQFAYTLHDSGQTYTRGWLQQYQRLQPTENRALQGVLKYVERHAHNTAADHDRLAAEINNIVGAAAFATETGQAPALRQLIQTLSQKAGDFVTQRGFQPEQAQIRKLSTLLVPPEIAQGATVPGAPVNQATQPTTVRATETTVPSAPIVEPPADTQATPVVKRLPQLAKPQSAIDTAETLQVTQPAEPVVPVEPVPEVTIPTPVQTSEPTSAQSQEAVPLTERPEPAPVIPEPPVSPEDTDIPTEASLPTIERQLADAREAGDLKAQAKLMQTLGQHHADQGDSTTAQDYYKQALDTYEKLEDKDGMLATLDALATITSQADDAEGALVYATRGVNLAQQIGEKPRLGSLQIRLGDVRLALGDLPAAIETYAQAAETLRGTEDWMTIGLVMAKLGNAYLEQNKPQEASMMLEQALTIFQREQRPDYEGRVLGSMGNAYGEMNQWPKAQEYHEQALALARDHGDQVGEAAELSALGHAREIQADMPGAIQNYRQALHVAYLLGDVDLQAEFTFALGSLLIDDSRTLVQAAQLLEESDKLVENSEAKRLLIRANKRLERTKAAGVPLPPAEASNRDYAAAAYNSVIRSTVPQ